MKLKEIAEQRGLDLHSLESFVLNHCPIPVNLTGIMRDSIDNESVDAVVDAYRDYLQERKTAKNAQDQQIREWRKSWEKAKEEYRTAAESIVMTTCPQVDGYRAVEQLGLVFGESLFKAGISSQVDALFDDAAPSPSIVDSELADTTDMLRKARERATMKMVLEAASRGAGSRGALPPSARPPVMLPARIRFASGTSRRSRAPSCRSWASGACHRRQSPNRTRA